MASWNNSKIWLHNKLHVSPISLTFYNVPTCNFSDHTHCGTQFFTCANYQCIPWGKHCDRQRDCLDGSDERDCPCDKDSEFQCRNNQCINKQHHCDQESDCDDHSDEVGCSELFWFSQVAKVLENLRFSQIDITLIQYIGNVFSEFVFLNFMRICSEFCWKSLLYLFFLNKFDWTNIC